MNLRTPASLGAMVFAAAVFSSAPQALAAVIGDGAMSRIHVGPSAVIGDGVAHSVSSKAVIGDGAMGRIHVGPSAVIGDGVAHSVSSKAVIGDGAMGRIHVGPSAVIGDGVAHSVSSKAVIGDGALHSSARTAGSSSSMISESHFGCGGALDEADCALIFSR